MNPNKDASCVLVSLLCAEMSLPALAEDKAKDDKDSGQADMMAMMMELMKPGENHKLLAQSVGSWTYTAKTWMNPDPKAPPAESTGSAVFREVMGGRYVIGE